LTALIVIKVLLALDLQGVARWAMCALATVNRRRAGGRADRADRGTDRRAGARRGPDKRRRPAADSPIPDIDGACVLTPVPTPALNTDWGSEIIRLAQTWLGVPYVFGGCSRDGVDCSCLVQNVYAAIGIHLPRVAVDQFNATRPVSDPQPGDLVFFANTYEPGISHVGMYIGNGMQINAPTTGQVVSVAPVFTGYGVRTMPALTACSFDCNSGLTS
jgi:peptidoglycan DL-endopeptidase CwlO